MFDSISRIFEQMHTIPLSHSFSDRADLAWILSLGNIVIGLACISIANSAYRVSRRMELKFTWSMGWLGFFLFCLGLTFFVGSYSLWTGDYSLSAPLKIMTALAAIVTAMGIFPLQSHLSVYASMAQATAQQKELLSKQNEELRISEERFRLLIDSVSDYAIYMLTPTGEIATWNEGAERLKGYTANEAIGKSVSIFYSAEDLEQRRPEQELEETRRSGRVEGEAWRIRKDGKKFWANFVITTLKDNHGKLIGFVKVTRDLTALKEAQDHLKESNREMARSQGFLDSMIENLPNMVFVKDAKELKFVRFNRAGEELLGFSRKDLIGKSDFDFFPIEQATQFVEKDRVVLSGRSIVDIAEETVKTRLNGDRILHTRKIPILGADGNPEYLLGISEDITDWKLAETERFKSVRVQAALLEREQHARRTSFLAEASTLLASSLDYHLTLNRLAQLIATHFADWCTITMIRPDRTKDRVAFAHRDPKLQPLIEELDRLYPIDADQTRGISTVIQKRAPLITLEVQDSQLVEAAKNERHLELFRLLGCTSCMVVPILRRGEVMGVIAFVAGATGRQFDSSDVLIAEELANRAGVAIDNALLYEATQQAVRARDEFLSIASHELKTPITSLKLQLQIMRKSTDPELGKAPSPEKLAKVLDGSTSQVNRITALIDDLLDVSRIGAGKMVYKFEVLDLAELVKDMVQRYRDHLSSAGCSVTVVAETPVKVRGDRFRMEQVVLNLLSNAAKYGAKKPISVIVTQTDSYAKLECIDQGIGIPPEKIDKIFERYERAVDSANISGLGLGLYISREIVRGHSGTIHAKSDLGNGTIFTVKLPLVLEG